MQVTSQIDSLPPLALLFDMDGTLTRPMLDFAQIRLEMGIDGPILEAMASMDAARRHRCDQILERHEERAASESSLNPGCRELLELARSRQIAMAVITRNSRRSVAAFQDRHSISFEVSITRDDCVFKPDPRPLLLACGRLRCEPMRAWMIGDGRHDLDAADAAGIRSVWISHGRPMMYGVRPWRIVKDLIELRDLLITNVGGIT